MRGRPTGPVGSTVSERHEMSSPGNGSANIRIAISGLGHRSLNCPVAVLHRPGFREKDLLLTDRVLRYCYPALRINRLPGDVV